MLWRLTSHHRAMEDHYGTMEALWWRHGTHHGVMEAHHCSIDSHHGTMEAQCGTTMLTMEPWRLTGALWTHHDGVEAHPGVVETHPKATEAHPHSSTHTQPNPHTHVGVVSMIYNITIFIYSKKLHISSHSVAGSTLQYSSHTSSYVL